MSDRREDGWLIVAIVLVGLGVLAVIGLTIFGVKENADQRAQGRTTTTQDIAEAKAAAIAAADAETVRKVCLLVAAIPDPPIGARYALALGCPPKIATDRTPSVAPSSSVPPAGPNRLESPGRTNTTGGTAPTSPRPTASPSASPQPSMTPTPPTLLCVLLKPLGGACP